MKTSSVLAALTAGAMLPMAANASLFATAKPLNYDEAKVPQYTLEDPLAFADGRKLADAGQTAVNCAACSFRPPRSRRIMV